MEKGETRREEKKGVVLGRAEEKRLKRELENSENEDKWRESMVCGYATKWNRQTLR